MIGGQMWAGRAGRQGLGGTPELMPAHRQRRQHLLSHHTDLHTKDASLLFGRSPLQAHVSAGEFHGEFHFDLLGGEAGCECLRSAPQVPGSLSPGLQTPRAP